jgi:uncharacterized phage protein (TIGR02216 family)
MESNFLALATRFAGQTALLLGWRPDDFWNATPSELAAILAAMVPQTEAVDATMLAELMKEFPDG